MRGDELGRYCSDPSREPGADKEVLDQPIGAELAESLAELWERADAVDELTELLDEELDPDSVYESERLRDRAADARASGVDRRGRRAAARHPDGSEGRRAHAAARRARRATPDAPVGPALRAVRRRQTPPPVIADPPRSSGMGFEEWML